MTSDWPRHVVATLLNIAAEIFAETISGLFKLAYGEIFWNCTICCNLIFYRINSKNIVKSVGVEILQSSLDELTAD